MLGIFSNNGRSARRRITARVKLYDGSDLTVHLEDTTLVFQTGWGVSRIALEDIERMENENKAITTRTLLGTNRFVIHCRNGSKIIGVPKSRSVLHLNGLNAPHERGNIELWEIDWLVVLTDQEEIDVFHD